MKRIIAIMAIVLACSAGATWQPHNTRGADQDAKPEAQPAPSAADGVPSWGLGPFVRDDGADFIRPNPASVFNCPVRKSPVHWEDQAVLCAAAVVKDNKVYVLYRAEDSSRSHPEAGKYDWGTSRIGIASSEDGQHFQRYPEPVLYPAEDEMKSSEWPGGCQDPRIVETRDGTFVMTYTAWDGKFARLAIATSKDLFHWNKQGLAFRHQLDGRFSRDFWSKSASIVCQQEGSHFIATRVHGKYWMYFNDSGIMLASSTNLSDWEIVLDDTGAKPLIIAPMRKGAQWFDQECTESGSPAFITPDGIFMIYNGMAPERPDLGLTGRIWSAGQILFDLKDMTKVIGRTDHDFFHPERDYEKQNVTSGKGGANNVTFVSNLIYFGGKWRFYYGCADSRVACAVSTPNLPLREKLRAVTQQAQESKLSPLFRTFSQDRLSREYGPADWAIGPFARIDRLTFEKESQWKDPWNIGWEGRAIHNASLLENNGKLYMFYRCDPAMESLSARIGLAIYTEGTGWIDDEKNPIIYSTLENEDLGCEDPKICRAEGRYFLFYEAVFTPSAEDRARHADPHYPVGDVGAEINVAESQDLIHWEKKGPILPRSLSHLWAKAAVIAKAGNGDAIRINGKYMMFISEGCGGKQIIGTSYDMRHWEFKPQQFLDTSPLGKLFEVDSCVAESANSRYLVFDFFYDDHSGVARAGEALYAMSNPTHQLALNRGGTLNVGGMIRCQGRWIHAQGWDAPPGRPVMYIYGTQK